MDQFGIDTIEWFGATLESGKSYILESFAPNRRISDGGFGLPGLYNSDGVTPATGLDLNCAMNGYSPAYPFSIGLRCSLRPADSLGLKELRISLFGQLTQFRIRLRETTIYSRWSTNGYNMYVALQNTSGQPAEVAVMLLDDAGGPFPVPVQTSNVSLPAYGSTQLVFPAGSLTPNRGTLRVLAGPPTFALMPGQVNVQAYAFNPAAGTYLFFNTERMNDGATSNR